MKNDSNIQRLDPPENLVPIQFAGVELLLREGENLAAELMAAGISTFRHTPVSGAPRAPFCMMGACFDCLVEIDGVTRQACMTLVNKGMIVDMPAKLGSSHD